MTNNKRRTKQQTISKTVSIPGSSNTDEIHHHQHKSSLKSRGVHSVVSLFPSHSLTDWSLRTGLHDSRTCCCDESVGRRREGERSKERGGRMRIEVASSQVAVIVMVALKLAPQRQLHPALSQLRAFLAVLATLTERKLSLMRCGLTTRCCACVDSSSC